MVKALLEQKASAVGGPNLSPTDEQFTAQCVHHAPGYPPHVLLGDEIAEHVPGCNMAYVKRDLAAIGGFDVTHRAVGDDVDVCWKLLLREKKIAFSPAPSSGTAAATRCAPIQNDSAATATRRRICMMPIHPGSTCSATACGAAASTTESPASLRSTHYQPSSSRGSIMGSPAARWIS